MSLREILSVTEIADVVAGAERVADAQQHPLVAQLEHVRAGDVLTAGDPEFVPRRLFMKERSKQPPLLHVGRREERWVVSS